ncbi:MAG TPA: hypothetical protein VGK52_13210, partial [Polyangia bacterium]
MNKLLIPSLIFAASVAIGCSSSSSTPKDAGGAGSGGGTAGSGGGTAGSAGGTAGSAGGTAGSAGGTAGSAGSTAGSDGGTAGADGGSAGADGGGTDATGAAGSGSDGGGADSAANIAALKLECPAKITAMNAATPFSAADFCALYANVCGSQNFSGGLTAADCETMYTSWASMKVSGMATVGVQNCTSYHLCNANLSMPELHCQHAAAKTLCNP